MTNNKYSQTNTQQGIVYDLKNIFGFLKSHIKLLLVGLILGALVGWVYSTYFVEKKYASYVDLYITNKKESTTDAVDYNDITSSRKLANTYVVILQSSDVLQNVLSKTESGLSVEQLRGMTGFSSVQDTEVLRLTVQSNDPQLTQELCEAYMISAQEALDSIVGAGSVKVISKPQLPKHPSSPNVKNFTITGALMGFVLMLGLSFLFSDAEPLVTGEKMLSEQFASVPVLGAVPDFFLFSKALGISREEVRKNEKLKEKNPENEKIQTQATVLSDKTPFPIREAYNGIRTNILFSLADMKSGIFIVTSPGANDLKTTTSINLAITLAQIGAKVLLIDGDLRNASIFRQLKVSNQKGLSRVIAGYDRFEKAVVRNVAPGVDFLPAGPSTQRPSEMLGSRIMNYFLKKQAYYYDFVIVDTSPLGVVFDSLSLAPAAAGYILVVRENKTTVDELDSSLRAIETASGKILGLVLTDVDTSKGNYGKYGYGKYGYGYGYGESRKKKK